MSVRDMPAHYPSLRDKPAVRPVWEFTSWLGEKFLATLPALVDWTITDVEDDEVRGELQLAVPQTPEFEPSPDWLHPLGRNGQTIRARVGVRDARDKPILWADMGQYRIVESEPDGEKVSVRAVGPAQRVLDARFTVDPLPLAASTFRERSAWLTQTLIPVTFSVNLVDRPAPEMIVAGRDRLKALKETLEAWPAVAEPVGPGLHIREPYEAELPTVEIEYADGEGGTLVSHSPDTGNQENVPNAYYVSNDTGTLSKVAQIDVGPFRYGGPYGFRPAFYSSPLFTDNQQCLDTAIARLARAQRRTSRIKATVVTDLRVKVGTRVRIRSERTETDCLGRVVEVTQKWDTTELSAYVMSGTIHGENVEGATLSSTAGLTPVTDIGQGRVAFPVGDTGTWSDRKNVWRTDTASLIVGRNEADATAGFVWWGQGPSGLPGTLISGALDLIREDKGDQSVTLTPQLVAGFRRVGTGKPIILSTANETITLPKVEPGEPKTVTWEIPPGWLPHFDSGEAGGLAFIAIEQEPATIAVTGRSLALRLDWRK